MKVRFKKIRDAAITPKYQTEGAACFDVHAVVEPKNKNYMEYFGEKIKPYLWIPTMSQCIIPTGLVFQLPKGYYLDIRPRSGLAAKHCITITNSPGTLDEDYSGAKDELCIILFNLGEQPFIVKQGDRIAQCKIEKVERAELEEITEEISGQSRGGFGSTGIN